MSTTRRPSAPTRCRCVYSVDTWAGESEKWYRCACICPLVGGHESRVLRTVMCMSMSVSCMSLSFSYRRDSAYVLSLTWGPSHVHSDSKRTGARHPRTAPPLLSQGDAGEEGTDVAHDRRVRVHMPRPAPPASLAHGTDDGESWSKRPRGGSLGGRVHAHLLPPHMARRGRETGRSGSRHALARPLPPNPTSHGRQRSETPVSLPSRTGFEPPARAIGRRRRAAGTAHIIYCRSLGLLYAEHGDESCPLLPSRALSPRSPLPHWVCVCVCMCVYVCICVWVGWECVWGPLSVRLVSMCGRRRGCIALSPSTAEPDRV